jgi:hypothetical protein
MKKSGNRYSLAQSGLVRTGSDRVSFAITAIDRFSGSNNPNGIYSASIFMDGRFVSSFQHDQISYEETRFMNGEVDYRYHSLKNVYLQHISPVPGAAVTALLN